MGYRSCSEKWYDGAQVRHDDDMLQLFFCHIFIFQGSHENAGGQKREVELLL